MQVRLYPIVNERYSISCLRYCWKEDDKMLSFYFIINRHCHNNYDCVCFLESRRQSGVPESLLASPLAHPELGSLGNW